MPLTITDLEDVALTVQPVDAMGNPADTTTYPITGMTASTSDPSIATVTPDELLPSGAGTYELEVMTTGKEGTFQVNFHGTVAGPGGPVPLNGTSDVVTVGPGEATSFTVSFGTPTERPGPAASLDVVAEPAAPETAAAAGGEAGAADSTMSETGSGEAATDQPGT